MCGSTKDSSVKICNLMFNFVFLAFFVLYLHLQQKNVSFYYYFYTALSNAITYIQANIYHVKFFLIFLVTPDPLLFTVTKGLIISANFCFWSSWCMSTVNRVPGGNRVGSLCHLPLFTGMSQLTKTWALPTELCLPCRSSASFHASSLLGCTQKKRFCLSCNFARST